MKKYRDNAVRTLAPVRTQVNFTPTGLIVWVGESKYWTHVWLCDIDHKLYIKTGAYYEALETFNIRETDTVETWG